MANIYVIDTSALISNPDVVRIPRGHWAVIPAVVLRQLDGLKNSSDSNTAYWARKASQAIEQQQAKGNLLIEGSSLDVNALDNKADNEIIGAALWARRNYVAKNVILVSTDRNMRIAAVNSGLKAEEGNGSKIKGQIWSGIFWACVVCYLLCVAFTVVGDCFSKQNVFFIFLNKNSSFFLLIGLIFLVPAGISVIMRYRYIPHKGNRPTNDHYENVYTDPQYFSLRGNIWHKDN